MHQDTSPPSGLTKSELDKLRRSSWKEFRNYDIGALALTVDFLRKMQFAAEESLRSTEDRGATVNRGTMIGELAVKHPDAEHLRQVSEAKKRAQRYRIRSSTASSVLCILAENGPPVPTYENRLRKLSETEPRLAWVLFEAGLALFPLKDSIPEKYDNRGGFQSFVEAIRIYLEEEHGIAKDFDVIRQTIYRDVERRAKNIGIDPVKLKGIDKILFWLHGQLPSGLDELG